MLLGPVLVLGLLVPAPASAAGGPSGGLVETLPARSAFSPNGDEVLDTVPIRFRLAERAAVAVRVPGVGTVDLGAFGPGRHRWRWDGAGADDGGHRLVVRARTGDGRTGRDTRYVELDRGAGLAAERVHLTRRTLYPSTPGKQDRIYVRSTQDGRATVVRIRDEDGDLVVDRKLWHWWSWDGDGLPPGEYAATFSLDDKFGNRRDIERTLTISPDVLVQRTWSRRVDAADVDLFASSCGISPSAVYAEGLRVAPGPGCERAILVPRFPIPVDVDPDVTWRLTVLGAGDPARVYVTDDVHVTVTPTPEGEGTTTTPWGGPHAYAWDPDREPEPAGYLAVEEPGTAYDVAELTLEVRYWTAGAASAPRP